MKTNTKLAQHKKSLNKPLRHATLCFLVRKNQVLLAMKKRGFAQGKWNGVGGKVDKNDKNVKEAAIRETYEEIGITPISMNYVATLNFYHIGNKAAGQQVIVYLSDNWEGEPTESEEMAPKWFDVNEIPYEKMWEDDRFWLPRILNGEIIEGEFLFDNKQNLLEQEIRKSQK